MSATISSPTTQRWLPQLLSGKPHQIIGPQDDPYLLRWFLIPPNRFCRMYWHRFLRSDEPTPHDHPWNFVSIVLRGKYFDDATGAQSRWRSPGQLAFRRATHTHRVVLARDRHEREKPCTTLVVHWTVAQAMGLLVRPRAFHSAEDFGPAGAVSCDEGNRPETGERQYPHTPDLADAAAVVAGLDRRLGAKFVNPLSPREYLALSEATVRSWPFGGWALLDDRERVIGYHWHEIYPVPDLEWTSETTAFAAFAPNETQRAQLSAAGCKVQRDADGALLPPYLCSVVPPWRHTP